MRIKRAKNFELKGLQDLHLLTQRLQETKGLPKSEERNVVLRNVLSLQGIFCKMKMISTTHSLIAVIFKKSFVLDVHSLKKSPEEEERVLKQMFYQRRKVRRKLFNN